MAVNVNVNVKKTLMSVRYIVDDDDDDDEDHHHHHQKKKKDQDQN